MTPLTILGLSLLLSYLLYKYVLHPTSPLSSLWITSIRRSSAGTRAIAALHKKHGPAIRLGPNELSICTPSALRTIYIGGFEKDRWYLDAFVNYGAQNMVSMLEHKPHSVQKRAVSNLYSKSYLHASEDLQKISHHLILEKFLPILHEVADKGIEMDVLDFFQAVGMDNTSAYLFSLTNATDFMHDVAYRRHWLSEYKTFKTLLPAARANSVVESSCMALCEAAERFLNSPTAQQDPLATQPVVYARLSSSLHQQALQAKPSAKPDPALIMRATASELLDHLIAGHETSGITLTYLIHELSQRPALQARLRAELLTLDPPISLPSNPSNTTTNPHLPAPKTIDALPLLSAILNETLRLYAAAPAPQPRITPHNPNGTGTTIDGYGNIPDGVRVSANAYTLHRNAEVWLEPETWRPERWMGLEGEGEKGEEMRRWFWPFGSGGRMCLGSHFAVQQMKLVTAAVYSNFTTEIIDDEGIEQSDEYISGPVGEKLVVRFRRV